MNNDTSWLSASGTQDWLCQFVLLLLSWSFCSCPETSKHTCKWCNSTPVSHWINDMQGRGQQVELHLGILHLYQLQWVDALPTWASDPTVDPENWRAYSYCDTAEDMKQTAHLYYRYWFQVNTVYLDDYNGSFFSATLHGFMSGKMSWNFSCPEIFLLNPGLMHTKNGKTWSVTAAVVDFTWIRISAAEKVLWWNQQTR